MIMPSAPPANLPRGVVLAGGLSSRMGQDKAVVMLGGKPLVHHVIERLAPQTAGLSVNSNMDAGLDLAPAIAVFGDTVPGHVGPMAGVLGNAPCGKTFPGGKSHRHSPDRYAVLSTGPRGAASGGDHRARP